MNTDEYGEVINGAETYERIAKHLREKESVIVGWSDGTGTHFDILFTLSAIRYGDQIQGGVRPSTDLFVSIMRWGCFAFDPREKKTHPGYYDEKLGNRGSIGSPTNERLAELINGVKTFL